MKRSSAKFAVLLMSALFAFQFWLTLFLSEGSAPPDESVLPITYLLVAVSALGLLWSVLSDRRGMIDLIFWYFFFFTYSWPGMLQTLTGRFPWQGQYDPGYANGAGFVVLVFLLSYVVGSIRTSYVRVDRTIVPNQLIILAIVMCIGLSVGCALIVGPSSLFVTRDAAAEALQDKGFAYPLIVGKGVTLTGFVLCASLVLKTQARRGSIYVWPIIIISGLLTVAWFNPLANPRFQTIAVAFAIACLVLRGAGPTLKASFILMMWLANLFVFGPFKRLAAGQSFELIDVTDLRSYLFRVDFDAYQQMLAAIKYVSIHGILFGENLLGALLFFVPRPLWPSKPLNSGSLVASNLGYSYVNISCPLPAEMYLAGGFVGVVLLSVLLGRVVSHLDVYTRVASRKGVVTYSCVLSALVGAYTLILLRGALGSVFPFIGLSFFFLAAIYIADRTTSGERVAGGLSLKLANYNLRTHLNRRTNSVISSRDP